MAVLPNARVPEIRLIAVNELDDVRVLAERLIGEHLSLADHRWTFRWDHARRRAGACHHDTHEISLSRHITSLGSIDDAEQTLLHEIAHALCGKKHNHSQKWLDTARSLGYTGRVRHTGPTPDHLARWRGTCAAGHVVLRYRKPRNIIASCVVCNPRFSRQHLIDWEPLG